MPLGLDMTLLKSMVLAPVLLSMGIASLPLAAISLILRGEPFAVFNKNKLSEANFTLIWRLIGKPSGDDFKFSQQTISQAYGIVLDLGPGTGFTVCHFDRSKTTKIFGIEPNKNFHPALKKAVEEAGLADIYTIIGTGVEDAETLKSFGIEEGSIDSIVACKVLCSVPKPKEMAKQLYKLLVPGGQMLVYEHVKAKGGLSVFIQDLSNIIWPFLMGGCELQRPTEAYLYGAGDWEVKDLKPAEGFNGSEFITFTHGKLVKAKL
ncbi:hypothetical protein H072_6865 [Dactylellina haptotyla CBS 200.50]|uniref:Methyltransferase type 11 domain-containing protein n=1 Tax=Dactylellina haptotyla (strain CBS 200.50) TaxID=1284197 RepID=S8AE40_DACHA|nr:hypothetical protein H072_6865 [Dactylellina haptotyla CBS 200.50]